jgi:hypothetical protein
LKASGATNASLQTWLRRELIIGQKDVPKPGSPSTKRSFSFFNVMEIAAAKALIDAGVLAAPAFRAAHRFAHFAGGNRLPALPAPGDVKTVLCVAGDHAKVLMWEPGADLFIDARHHLLRPLAFVVLDMSELFDRVSLALGYDPRDILEQEYRSQAGAE